MKKAKKQKTGLNLKTKSTEDKPRRDPYAADAVFDYTEEDIKTELDNLGGYSEYIRVSEKQYD